MSFDQEIVRVLRQVPEQRLVVLARRGEELVATRFFLPPVKLAFSGLVAQVAMTGAGSIGGLPEALTLNLEGYRVRASLGEVPGLPAVVSAGVTAEADAAGLGAPAPGFGYAYVSTPFVAGRPLGAVREQLGTEEKAAVLRRLLRLLARLHEKLVVHGDLKPDNVVAVGEEPWLIDLDTMRSVARADLPIPTRDLTPAYAAPEQAEEQLTYLVSDVYAFGRLGAWLLEEELAAPAPAIETWGRLFEKARIADPAARPSARELLAEAGLTGRATGEGVAQTVPVMDAAEANDTVQAWPGVFAAAGSRRRGAASNPAETLPIQSRPPPDPGPGPAPPADATEHVPEGRPAPEEPDPDPLTPHPAPAGRRPRRWILAAGAALLLTAALAALFARPWAPSAADESAADAASNPLTRAPSAGPRPFDLCDDEPERVAVTYLFPERPVPPPSEILSWFSGVKPRDVEIYRFRHSNDGDRFVSFELSKERWEAWEAIAGGASGEELCARIGAELVERGLGQRGAAGPGEERYEFDFLGERSPRVIDLERLGDLRGVANGDVYAEILDWMEPLEVSQSRCETSWSLTDSYLEIDCEVENPRETSTAVRVLATMSREDLEPVERHEQLVLDAGESARFRFSFPEYRDGEAPSCECSASTLP